MCVRARVCDVNREGSVEVAEPEDPSWRRCGEDWVSHGEDWVSRGAGGDGPGECGGAREKGFEGLRSHGANIVWDTAVGKVLVHFVPSGVG